MFTIHHYILISLNALYLLGTGVYFLSNRNNEFIIYTGLIVVVMSGAFLTLRYSRFPVWMLWALSFWGLMHILGGAVHIGDHVLFAQRLYPFIDLGGEFYILKYDQVVHAYLFGLLAIMSYHLFRNVFAVRGHKVAVFVMSIMVSLGVSSMNEIMEFFISITMENGVGGYENTMLDFCFNLGGAVIALSLYLSLRRSE
jgi:putative membrane protein